MGCHDRPNFLMLMPTLGVILISNIVGLGLSVSREEPLSQNEKEYQGKLTEYYDFCFYGLNDEC